MSTATTEHREWQDGARYVPRTWARDADLFVESGAGCWLTMSGGDRYLDLTAGIAVASTGHAHPRVVQAVAEQAGRLLHGQQGIVYHQPGVELHRRLPGHFPGVGVDARIFLLNSGSEAVEAAVKLAKRVTRRPAIICFHGGFHGRTHFAMALTSSMSVFRAHYEPLASSVYFASYPTASRDGPDSDHSTIARSIASIRHLFATLVDPADVAAFLVEPILGEGGYVVPPDPFLAELKDLASQHGILLIVDEIQTGFGRTGRMFATEWSGATPDIVVMGKGIASGLPLSGIMAAADLMDQMEPGANGGTFGGNVVSCAAALATLDVLEDENLTENALSKGAALMTSLRQATEGLDAVVDIRGRGLMIGIEFANPASGDPRPDLAAAFISECRKRHVLVKGCGTYRNVIRLMPPLVLTEEDVLFANAALLDAAHSLPA
jgi:4-aminobutyrate aminotransferase